MLQRIDDNYGLFDTKIGLWDKRGMLPTELDICSIQCYHTAGGAINLIPAGQYCYGAIDGSLFTILLRFLWRSQPLAGRVLLRLRSTSSSQRRQAVSTHYRAARPQPSAQTALS